MRSPSDTNNDLGPMAMVAAQVLRGGSAFLATPYCEGGSLSPEEVQIDLGYADCLPIMGGGLWRDPASPITMETTR